MLQRQRGMALLVILLIIAMMTLLIATSTQYARQALTLTDSSQAMLQVKWDLLGAERWFLATQPLDRPADVVHQRQFGSQPLRFALRDRQACFNLNALLPQSAPDAEGRVTPSVARQVFLHMLENLDLPAAQANTLMQQMIAMGKPDPGVNQWRLFDEISQLRVLPAVTPDLWRRLQPLLCVTPETRLAINVNGLKPEQMPLFSALFAGQLSSFQLREMLAARPAAGWVDSGEMVKNISHQALEPALPTLQSIVVTHSRYFELLIRGDHPTIFSALRSRVERQDSGYRVSARLYGLSE